MHGWMFWAAVGGAAITAFYMFRLWYMTFAGQPRDEHVYHHAHESPRVMVAPLVVLAALAVCAGWNVYGTHLGLEPLLAQGRPAGLDAGASAGWNSPQIVLPAEARSAEEREAKQGPAAWWAFAAALAGFFLATAVYGLRTIDAEDIRRQFAPLHRFLVHKWWFDELYDWLWVQPVLRISQLVADVDRQGIDRLADGSARLVAGIAQLDDWIDRLLVDGLVNLTARWTHAVGLRLRSVQTGNVRQYVMLLVLGMVLLFILTSVFF